MHSDPRELHISGFQHQLSAVVVETLNSVLQLESFIKRHRISTDIIWMMQGIFTASTTGGRDCFEARLSLCLFANSTTQNVMAGFSLNLEIGKLWIREELAKFQRLGLEFVS